MLASGSEGRGSSRIGRFQQGFRLALVGAFSLVPVLFIGTPSAVAAVTARAASAPAPAPASAPASAVPSNVLASTDHSSITANDTATLVQSPANSADLVIVNRIDRPDYTAAVEYSTNSGTTWSPSALQMPPESDYPGALALVTHKLYAPEAVFDAQGTLYVVFVTLSGPGNQPDGVWVESSTDAGQSFRPPSAVAGAGSYEVSAAINQSSGELFVAWLRTKPFLCVLCFPTTGQPIVVSHSVDGGQTWSTPVQVSTPGLARVGAPAMVVDSHGNPAVLYYDYGADTLDWGDLPGVYHGTFSLRLTRSQDGGATFGASHLVSGAIVPTRRFIVYLAPRAGLAIGPDGTIVVAWPDSRYGTPQVLLETSSDGGTTWSSPVVVSKGSGQGQAQSLPAVSVAPNGRIDVLYYGGSGATTNVFLASSIDGGRTFPVITQVTTTPSSLMVGPPSSPYASQADLGSGISLVSENHHVLAAWTDTRNGTVLDGQQQIYFAIVAAVAPVAAGPGALLLGVVIGGGVLAVVGIALVIGVWRGRKGDRATTRRGPPSPPTARDGPPPPPPLVASPGQV